MTADAAQKVIGVSPAAWRNYFTNHTRDVPSKVLIDLANLFEMPLSRFIALAEAEEIRIRQRVEDPTTIELLDSMSPSTRQVADALRDPFRERAEDADGEAEAGRRATG